MLRAANNLRAAVSLARATGAKGVRERLVTRSIRQVRCVRPSDDSASSGSKLAFMEHQRDGEPQVVPDHPGSSSKSGKFS